MFIYHPPFFEKEVKNTGILLLSFADKQKKTVQMSLYGRKIIH